MVDFGELKEGISLGGLYTLGHFIPYGGSDPFFEVFTGDGERQIVKLVASEDPEAEPQFATWRRSRLLRHPHLQDLRDVGRCELAGNSYFYAVFEYPDDVLSS